MIVEVEAWEISGVVVRSSQLLDIFGLSVAWSMDVLELAQESGLFSIQSLATWWLNYLWFEINHYGNIYAMEMNNWTQQNSFLSFLIGRGDAGWLWTGQSFLLG